jgi:hypothetical protein
MGIRAVAIGPPFLLLGQRSSANCGVHTKDAGHHRSRGPSCPDAAELPDKAVAALGGVAYFAIAQAPQSPNPRRV